MQHPPVVLTGPTACGKSEIALHLAPLLQAEIVSADSMAVYRGMDIGTAKPSPEARAAVPHHLIDVADPAETFSVGRFVALASAALADLRARKRTALIVGGTPLYLRALLLGLFDGPPADPALRARLMAEAREEAGRAELHRRLAAVDPEAARRLHRHDVKRIVRALEVHALTGRPISSLQTQWSAGRRAPALDACRVVVLDRRTDDLRERVRRRTEAMFAAGLVEEVRGLLRRAGGLGRTARAAVGYAEVVAHLERGVGLEETVEGVRRHTWRVVRKQRTWLRRFGEDARLEIAPEEPPEKVARGLYKWIATWHNHRAQDGERLR